MVTIEELTLDEEPVEVKAPADHLSSVSISDSNAPITPDVQTSGESSEPSRHSDLLQQERMERAEATRTAISQQMAELLAANPALPKRTLAEMNTGATKLCNSGDALGAVALYKILFTRAAQLNLMHPELYVCHSNCSAACLKLELFEEALEHAGHCNRLAEASLRRNFKGSSSYIKSFVRKGQALLALSRHREAVSTFEAGLALDPINLDLKLGLETANEGVLRDLAEGKGHEHRSITYPEPSQRITYHPYSAPLHRVRTEDMLPARLLTPFQAENDHNIKDTYNYMTVQADVRMPQRIFRQLEDSYYNAQWKKAVSGAVQHIESSETDCRVLNLGAGAGVQAVTALQAGARHVTAAERWLYLALASKETLQENEVEEDRYSVIYKRPSDLKIKEDVPVCCNLLIANILDEGLLSSGIIPAVRHALDSLTTHEAVVLPASATVYMQAVELRTTRVCGLDMSAANLYRWQPAYSTGAPWDKEAVRPLSAPIPVWYFNFSAPPESSDVKNVDVEFTAEGRFNAVMFWYDLHLWGDVHLSSGPDADEAASGERYLQPALQYLAGELRVDPGTIMPVIASHNTVRMRFDIETADYLHLMKTDASFPHRHFDMLADTGRLAAYDRAIARAVARRKAADGEAHVLDLGTGTGALALMAARAGASSVVACDLHASLCDVARKSAAANGLAQQISVVQKDVALLQRGREVRPLGVNIVVADMFDAGLTGDQFPYLLELTRKKVVQPGATVVPTAATLYCMGIEALTTEVEGVKLSAFNAYRWDAEYSAVRLADLPHRRLTAPAKVSETFFDGEKRPRPRDSLVKLDVVATGTLNAVVFWFDLHLDEVESVTSAPDGIGQGGVLSTGDRESSSSSSIEEKAGASKEKNAKQGGAQGEAEAHKDHYWGQALQYLDRAVTVEPDRKITLLAKREGSKIRLALRPGVGDWVGRAPWKVEWGGGSSVENPHFQRVHYCELLVRDFLMRCKSERFPSIQKDINMVLAHCGSLFLDPASLEEAGHQLVVLEKLHTNPEFSPGASLEALTRPQLRRC